MAQTSQAKAQTMRAVALDKFGGPEALKIQNLPIPQIETQEVLIRVEAAGVGAWDPFEREGRFVEIMGVKPSFPYVLGTDGAGTIAAVGKDVNRFKEGDRVYAAALANPKGGFYAQYAAVKADNASLIPGRMTIEQAAVLPTDGLTALTGLEKVLGLKSGESLMVFGASGGIGHLAIQLAKRLGAKVFAIASGEERAVRADLVKARPGRTLGIFNYDTIEPIRLSSVCLLNPLNTLQLRLLKPFNC